MTTGQGPTTTRRRLRAELRSLRLAKGLSVEDATNEVEWSTSKLVKIEGGQVSISVSDLDALLTLYGVDDQAHREELRALARASRQRTWWRPYQRHISASYLEFIGAESDATRIRHYHPTTVPGLLQTLAYANAVIEDTALDPLPSETAEARNAVRRLRQQHILDRPEPPILIMILDEAVLCRPVGGKAAMREQLDSLIRLAERDTTTLVVVPFSAGLHPGLMGAFTLMEYDDPLNDDVLCLETANGDVLLQDRPETIDQYRRVADRLEALGLSEPESIEFVQQMHRILR